MRGERPPRKVTRGGAWPRRTSRSTASSSSSRPLRGSSRPKKTTSSSGAPSRALRAAAAAGAGVGRGERVGPDEGARRQGVAGVAHPLDEVRADGDERVGQLDAAPLHEDPAELGLGVDELLAALGGPQRGRVADDDEVRVAEGEAERLGEQRAVAQPVPVGDVDDVEGLLAGAQPAEQRPAGRGDSRQRGLRARAGHDGLEGDAVARVEGAGRLHLRGVGGVVVDVGDGDLVAPGRELPRQVMIGGADAAVPDRARGCRGSRCRCAWAVWAPRREAAPRLYRASPRRAAVRPASAAGDARRS